MLSFLHPLYLLLLPLGALPLLLNLVKRRVRLRLAFPSVILLQRVEERHARRRPAWRDILLVALRSAAVVTLVLMAAGPRFSRAGGGPPRALFLIIDNSPSMTYIEGGESRLGRAVRWARAAAAAAGPDDVVAVAGTGGGGAVAWSSGADSALKIKTPPAAAGGLADALAESRAVFGHAAARGRRREVAVFTDMQVNAYKAWVAGNIPAATAMTFYDVRADRGPWWNVALTAARAYPVDERTFDVEVEARQYGKARPVVVAVSPGAAAPAEVGAAPQTRVRFRLSAGGRYVFTARGGYPFDDEIVVELPPTAATPTFVAADVPGRRFWETVFPAVGAASAGGGVPGQPPGIVVASADDWRTRADIRTWVGRGGVAVVIPGGAGKTDLGDGSRLDAFAPAPGPVSADASVLPFTAAAAPATVAGVMPVTGRRIWAAVAATPDGKPYIVRRDMGKGEVFAFAAPPESAYSNFFQTPAFVAFARDLRARALSRAFPAYDTAAGVTDVSESDTAQITVAELRKLSPAGADVRNAPPAGPAGTSLILRGPLAAFLLMVLAAEALVASAAGFRANDAPVKPGAAAARVR